VALDIKRDNSLGFERPAASGESLRFIRPIRSLLELVPEPAMFWSLQRHFCIPNQKAHQWVSSAKNDFREYAANWSRKIDRLDRPKFLSVWQALQSGKETVRCDYGFSPDGTGQKLWLRESSTSYRNWQGEAEGLISVYTDISDLRTQRWPEPPHETDKPAVPEIRSLAHDIANCVHNISIELELMGLRSGASAPPEVVDTFNRLQRCMRELLEYCAPKSAAAAGDDLNAVLEARVRRLNAKLLTHGVVLELACEKRLPPVRIGSEALAQVLEQLVESCGGQLKQGGRLTIQVGVIGGDGQKQVEVKLSSASPDQLKRDSLKPFLQIDDCRVGVSTSVAQQILRDHGANVFFTQPPSKSSVLTIRFETK
jgi:hypothetical protein